MYATMNGTATCARCFSKDFEEMTSKRFSHRPQPQSLLVFLGLEVMRASASPRPLFCPLHIELVLLRFIFLLVVLLLLVFSMKRAPIAGGLSWHCFFAWPRRPPWVSKRRLRELNAKGMARWDKAKRRRPPTKLLLSSFSSHSILLSFPSLQLLLPQCSPLPAISLI